MTLFEIQIEGHVINLSNSWAIEELAKINFGDKRLVRRILKVAGSQAKPLNSQLTPNPLTGPVLKGPTGLLTILK